MDKKLSLDFTKTSSLKSRLKKAWPLWIGVIVVLVIVGFFAFTSIEQSARDRLTQTLDLVVDADVTALKLWLEIHEHTVQAFASDQLVIEQVSELVELKFDSDNPLLTLSESEQLRLLREDLREKCEVLEYDEFVVMDMNGFIIASLNDESLGEQIPLDRFDFVQKALSGEVTVSRPFPAVAELPDDDGVIRKGTPTMFTVSPIFHETGRVIAVLALRINPETRFTQILRIARIWDSGEAYAFDRNGLMLSQSRFDDQLRSVGLLPKEEYIDSTLNIEVRDPGGNLLRGFQPTVERDLQPLTWAVNNAIVKSSGFNIDGYRDYRGIYVIGAWRWLDKYDFGVVFEVDYAEAYLSLRMLRITFGILFLLLLVAALSALSETLVISKLRSKISRAESKLEQLGQYTLVEKLGSGGMGEVYRAKHAMLRRPTAVKLLKPERSSPEMIGRFEREVQLTSQLTHPNTIAIFDYGRTPDNVFYYAMELLEGINLEDLVETFGPQPSERVRFILLQACASLQEAHIVGLIHRDIKPANIFLCVRGGLHDFVKVLDFGLVRLQEKKAHEMTRLTQLGTTTGTPAFMAPEMILGEDLDCRVDIYALGCVGYWLLTGKLLFEGGNAMAMAMAHTKEEPIPPSERVRKPISPSIEKVILSCLEKDPSKRPSSAESLAQLLEECELGNEWSHETAKSWWNRFIYKTKDQSSPRTRLE